MNTKISYMVGILIGLLFIAGTSTASFGEDFYKGKTIRVIVGFSPGGGYDTYARTVARHMGKYVPGNPSFVVQNMAGAGSLIAANYLYSRARRDGLTLAVWDNGQVLFQALGDPRVKLDGRQFGWIGAPVRGWPTCGVMGFTGMKTFEDVLKSKKPIKMGATRAGATLADLPKILNLTLGTNFEVIAGYRGSATIRTAMQKKEVDGACYGWESMRVTARAMLDAEGDDKFIPFIIHKKFDDPEVKDLPLIPETIKARGGERKAAIYNAWAAKYDLQRPYVAPPGLPKERLEILRKAFKAALEDPKLLAEAKKANLVIDYVSPEEINKSVEDTLSMSPEVKESLQFLVVRKKKKK